jgi:ADP-heptose:LPS heptosyltransferase
LGQLGAGGDCLYATILAHQLRHDFPDAEICWAISTQCKGLIDNNPHISEVWEIPTPDWSHHEMIWRLFEREAQRLYQRGTFDMVLLSQIWPNNFQNYDGTVRSSLLRSYHRPVTVPVENVIRLRDHEIERVDAFARKHNLKDKEHRILFECSSKSGQSSITPDIAQTIADLIYMRIPSACVIFSTHLPMTVRDPRSLYVGGLTLREIAHLTHYSTLFVGTGSGGTVAATSTAAKILPVVQLLKASTSVFASFAHDFEHFGLTGRKVLETTNEDPEAAAAMIAAVCRSGIGSASTTYGTMVPVDFTHYLECIENFLISKFRYLDAAASLSLTARRYGWAPALLAAARDRVAPNLKLDPVWYFAPNRHLADKFLTELEEAGAGSLRGRQRLWSDMRTH